MRRGSRENCMISHFQEPPPQRPETCTRMVLISLRHPAPCFRSNALTFFESLPCCGL
jgi:hypothetical protein